MNAETDQTESVPRRRYGTHLLLLSCVALVTAFFIWATLGELDVVSSVTGEVVPLSKVKSIQHLEGGIVRDILVREGDRVSSGQPLIELQPTTSDTQVEELKISLSSLRVKIGRLEAETAEKDKPDFPPDLVKDNPALVNSAIELFHARQRRVNNQIDEQRQLITQREQEIKGVQSRIRNNEHSLELMKEQVAITEKLLKMDLANRMRHLEQMKEVSNLQRDIDSDNALLPQARAAQKQAQARLEAIMNGFQEEARIDLGNAQQSFEELTQRLRKFEDSLKRTILRAPADGIIKTLYVTTRGGVIQAGQTVVDIVPAGDRLIIEAKLPTGDVGFVRKGQKAKIRLASADAVRFGAIESEVIHVSPDTMISEQGAPYYKVSINTEQDHFERGGLRYDLVPGMQVQCDIQTGTRTVLEYLLDPYIRSAGAALRER
ncbi:MAG: hypothetical protein A3G18_13245 [Rhodospirillales bacterium RIFCSPLOWO2_12_FULL_58_28]|nr:MAG: hypothetical protein A3H92_13100 [Rhodospirillales bacterium RIFCSPLOWO2_02_FULL_58_16]OHC78544.1 MAG: hypothetical protein A3G18_13245 [Rhodospirillales bacterium RIFCSPLOWO2_12_FULL_58_28]